MNKLADAAVFSKAYHIDFEKAVAKPVLEGVAAKLVEDIGRPLSHRGIIAGHIKVLAKVSDEEFMFLSLTRLDSVDLKFSAKWTADLARQCSGVDLDVNVLIFGHSEAVIEDVVERSLAVLRSEGNKG